MYLTEQRVRELLRTLRDMSGPDSHPVVNFGLGTRAPHARGDRSATLTSRVALALQGEPVTFRLPPPDAPDFITDTGWTIRQLLTAPDLIQLHLPGTDMPTAEVNPTAYAVEAARTVSAPSIEPTTP